MWREFTQLQTSEACGREPELGSCAGAPAQSRNNVGWDEGRGAPCSWPCSCRGVRSLCAGVDDNTKYRAPNTQHVCWTQDGK